MQDLRLVEVREAQAMGVQGAVVTVLAVGILILIGVFVYSEVTDAIPTSGFTAAENTTYDQVKDNILDGFNLLGIVVILVAVAALFGALYMIFR